MYLNGKICLYHTIVVVFLLGCLAPIAGAGYTIGTLTGLTIGSTADVSCATGYTGTPLAIACVDDGDTNSWTSQSGCNKGK